MPTNGETLNGAAHNLHDHQSADYQACFIFSQGSTPQDASRRPRKKRRLSKNALDEDAATAGPSQFFSPLLGGSEKPNCVALRYATYQKLWSDQEDHTNGILQEINAKTLNDVTTFIENASPAGSVVQTYCIRPITYASEQRCYGKIPTGLILTGPGIASHGLLFEQLVTRIQAEDIGPAVVLTSGEASNLKTVLKKLIRKAAYQINVMDEDMQEDEVSGKAGN
ncbi:hypothetical protein GP486_001522 [Trichoglossum hirsutum]|uniref:Origin recognition complex subunit 3 N-terminal domain-containing protein n=1 Tax=Trichoglossum hirsutum TaxID=265104 RepID=A0A9P8RSZ2_9PEZI|nr:hypothetical protein GP486_001522 [Trichoglossum hirsutum]